MISSWWRLKSLAALVLNQPTELAGLTFWQQTRKHDWTKKKIRYGHSLCYLVISTEVYRKYYKASFEVSKGSFATLSFTRQNCLQMALDIQQTSTLSEILQK
jgi:hypothetical protein